MVKSGKRTNFTLLFCALAGVIGIIMTFTQQYEGPVFVIGIILLGICNMLILYNFIKIFFKNKY